MPPSRCPGTPAPGTSQSSRTSRPSAARPRRLLGEELQFRNRHRPAGHHPHTECDGSPNYAVLGGRSGPFPESREVIVDAYHEVLNGRRTSGEALHAAAVKATTPSPPTTSSSVTLRPAPTDLIMR